MAKRMPPRRKPPSPGTLPKKGADQLAAIYQSAADRLEAEGVSPKRASQRAARQAWCEVKRYYKKVRGKWAAREVTLKPDEYPPGCKPYRGRNKNGSRLKRERRKPSRKRSTRARNPAQIKRNLLRY